MTDRKVVPNVMEFITRAAVAIGAWERDRFSQEMFNNAIEIGLESPIEDMFWIACNALCRVAYENVNPTPDYDAETDTATYQMGMYIQPQAKIGKYRVDFLVQRVFFQGESEPVVVELDGHDFHDKDKKQRSYEKARDRDLVKAGYRVMHYTGSDINTDPFRVAWEVLEMVGALGGFGAYDPADPLQTGE